MSKQLDIFRDNPALPAGDGVEVSKFQKPEDSASKNNEWERPFYIHCARVWLSELRYMRKSEFCNQAVYWFMFWMVQDVRRDAFRLTLDHHQQEAA